MYSPNFIEPKDLICARLFSSGPGTQVRSVSHTFEYLGDIAVSAQEAVAVLANALDGRLALLAAVMVPACSFDFLVAYNRRTLTRLGQALLHVPGTWAPGGGVPSYASARLTGWGKEVGFTTGALFGGLAAGAAPDGLFTASALVAQALYIGAWLQDIVWAWGKSTFRPVALRSIPSSFLHPVASLLGSRLTRVCLYGTARPYSARRFPVL